MVLAGDGSRLKPKLPGGIFGALEIAVAIAHDRRDRHRSEKSEIAVAVLHSGVAGKKSGLFFSENDRVCVVCRLVVGIGAVLRRAVKDDE